MSKGFGPIFQPASIIFKQMPDAVLSQADPVSATIYPVLALTDNIKIIGLACRVTWATTQPTNMDIIVTIDGIQRIYESGAPVSETWYYPYNSPAVPENAQPLEVDRDISLRTSFPIEGSQISVGIRITWATTQPTPLECRVKYKVLV